MIRLTYDALVAADPAVAAADPAAFAVTYLGQPADIRLIQAAAGAFAPGDSVVFYAEPYEGRYLNHNVYWFTWGESGSGRGRMALRTVTPDPAAPVVTEITRTLHIERDLRYMSTIGRPKDSGPLVRRPDRPTLCAHLHHAQPQRHRVKRPACHPRPDEQRRPAGVEQRPVDRPPPQHARRRRIRVD